jgi:hypothetical protein
LAIVNQLPAVDRPCGDLIFDQRSTSDEWHAVGRLDYQASENHSVFGRYLVQHLDLPDPLTLTPNNPLNASGTGADDLSQGFVLGSTYLLRADTANTLHLGFNRFALNRTAPKFFGLADIGINAFSYVPKAVGVTITGGFGLSGQGDSTARTTTYLLRDSLSLVRGMHLVD